MVEDEKKVEVVEEEKPEEEAPADPIEPDGSSDLSGGIPQGETKKEVVEEKAEEPKVEAPSEVKAEDAPVDEAKEEEPAEEKAEEPKEKAPAKETKKSSKKKAKVEEKKEETPTDEKTEEPAKDAEMKPAKKKVESEYPPLFGLYNLSEVEIEDPGLRRYINLNLVTVPHVSARYANKQFGKAKVSIIERLMNGMMRTEDYTGKKSKSYKVVEKAFAIIHQRTKENPVQVLVQAIENSSPKEEITRLRFGGISVPKAVDISPSRRLDIALRNICSGAVNASHKNRKSIEECLANELIAGSKGEMNSFGVSKKEEIERVAASAR